MDDGRGLASGDLMTYVEFMRGRKQLYIIHQ